MQVAPESRASEQVSAAVVSAAIQTEKCNRPENQKDKGGFPARNHLLVDVSIEVDGDDWAYCKSDN